MKLDRKVIDFLKTYFVPRRGDSHVAGSILPGGTNTYNLGASTNRWDTIYARQVVADSLTGGGGAANADTLDGYHASLTPAPNTILPLDASQKYPSTTYPDALLRNGTRSLTGNLDVAGGVTIDGVDISNHAVDNTIHHIGGMGADSHTQYMHISQSRTVSATHTYQPGAPSPPFYLGANAQDQLITGLYATRAVNLDRYVVAGSGLTGGGQLTGGNVTLDVGGSANIQVNADDINLATPGTLSVSSTNQAATAHTHGITASSNPGVSSALLKSGSDGSLYLGGDFGVDTDTLFVDVSEDAVYINAGTLPSRRGALTVHPANVNQRGLVLEQLAGQVANMWTVFDSSGNDLIILTNAGDLESGNPGFVSGLTGWQITHTGDAEFWNAVIRGELHASVFVADEMHATGGTLAVLTASSVDGSGDNVMGATGAQFYLRMKASYDTGLSYFAVNDVIRLKFMGDSGGLDIWDVYVEVDSIGSVQSRDMGNGDPGYFRMLVTRRSGGASGLEIPPGTAGVKWGNVSGTDYSGGMVLTSDLTYSPYLDIFTIDNSVTYDPWEANAIKPRVRVGNLGGVLGGSADEWGIAFGNDLSDTSSPYGVFSDLRASLHGVAQSWWDLDGNIRGEIDPTAYGSASLFWLGKSASDRSMNLDANGLLTLTSGLIGPGDMSFADSVVHLPFMGDRYTGHIDVRNWIDMTGPDVATGSIHGGKGPFSNAFAIGRTGTNYTYNAAVEDGVNDWIKVGTGTLARATTYYVYGSGSLRITAGSADTYLYNQATTDTPLSISNNGYVSASCYVRVDTGITPGSARLRIYDKSAGTYRATVSNTSASVNGWELLQVTWYNTSGAARNVEVRLSNNYNNSSTNVWFDAVMLEVGAYHNTFFARSDPMYLMPGISIVSDVGVSRTKQDLEYNITVPSSAYTISCWFEPHNLCTNISSNGRVWEWYGDSDDRLILYQNSTSNRVTAYHQASGSLANIDSPSDPTVGVFHHFLMTFDGSRMYFYVDGAYVNDVAASSSFGTTPNVLAIGTDYAGNNENPGGYIADFFSLSKFVTADEVAAIYNSSNPVRITNDFAFNVGAPGYGIVSMTLDGTFFTNAYGINSLMINTGRDPLTYKNITVEVGDILFGMSDVNYASSSILFKRVGTNMMEFYSSSGSVLGGITQNADFFTSHAYISTDKIALYNIAGSPSASGLVITDGEYSSQEWARFWGWYTASQEQIVVGTIDPDVTGRTASIWFTTATTPLSKITLSVDDTTRNADVTLEASAAEGGVSLNIDTTKTRFYDAVKYVREPGGGTDRTGSMYVPLTSMIGGATLWGHYVSNAGGASKTVSSEWSGVPANVSAIAVRIHARDSVAWSVPENPSTGLFFQMGPANATNQYDHLSMHPIGENAWAAAQGIVKVTSNTVYVKWNASGASTMQVYVGVVGYFI